jgi:hypothetical protein
LPGLIGTDSVFRFPKVNGFLFGTTGLGDIPGALLRTKSRVLSVFIQGFSCRLERGTPNPDSVAFVLSWLQCFPFCSRCLYFQLKTAYDLNSCWLVSQSRRFLNSSCVWLCWVSTENYWSS